MEKYGSVSGGGGVCVRGVLEKNDTKIRYRRYGNSFQKVVV